VTQIEEYGRFVRALMPKLAADENHLAREIYNALATIGAVSVDRLAEGTGFAPSRVEAILSPWPGAYREDRGDIIEFWGLTARPISKHVLRINGHTSYAWCAWDCLFLPAPLGRSMQVTSVCAQTGDAIELLVSPSSVERSSRLRQCCQCSVETWSRPAKTLSPRSAISSTFSKTRMLRASGPRPVLVRASSHSTRPWRWAE
jgi:hypothetical protein